MRLENSNPEAFESELSLERYSHYTLLPQERELFGKYYRPADKVLDLACGAGRTTVRLFERGIAVKGIALSERLICAALRRFPHIDFASGNFCEIPEPDQSFDHVLISYNGLDYANPETDRERAIRECFRVLYRLGTFIYSSHNIKSLHCSPYYRHWDEIVFKLRHSAVAFRDKGYLKNPFTKVLAFHASPEYVINQTEEAGFEFVEMLGFRNSRASAFNRYFSPYIHYVFRKP